MSIKTLEDLLQQYNALSDSPELEIRYQNVSRELFTSLVEALPGSKAVEQSINVIHEVDRYNSIRREKYFTGNKSFDKYIKKKTVGFVRIDKGTKKISLSREIPMKPQKLNNAKHMRFKSRLSATVDDWRVDMTIVKETDPVNTAIIKTLRRDMFNDPHPNKFLQEGPMDLADKYEVEIEYIGDSALTPGDVEDIINKIESYINPDLGDKQEYKEKLHNVAKYLFKEPYLSNFRRKWGFKKLGNAPIELTKKTYLNEVLPNITNYYVTDKADGDRCVVYINDEPGDEHSYILTARKVIPIDNTHPLTIIDAELVKDNIYIFDVMYFKGEKLYKKPFEERLKYFEDAAKLLTRGDVKPMERISEKLGEIKKMFTRKTRSYPIDGLMFTPTMGRYDSMKVYKWKPVDKLSVDFLIIKPPSRVIGIKPFLNKPKHDLYFLFCGIRVEYFRSLRMEKAPGYNEVIKNSGDRYMPIQFAPSDNPYAYIYYHPTSSAIQDLHYHIGEFIYELDDSKWTLERMRPDKDVDIPFGYYGNDYRTIDDTWQSLRDPMGIDDLVNPDLSLGYFAKEKAEFYLAVAGFNSFVKSRLMENFRNANYVIDAAAGRGQDLFRLENIGVKIGFFIDIDKNAIGELNSRKYNLRHGMKVQTWVADLSKPAKNILEEYKEKYNPPVQGADGFMINFAIHYVAGDISKLRNFIQIIKGMTKVGSRIIITCFDGEVIFDLLKNVDIGKSWDIHENTVLKYSLRKLYKSKSFAHGQKIAVKLPFTGENYYEEPLIDTHLLIDEFAKEGFGYEIFNPFTNYLSQFKIANQKMFAKLTDDDKKYINLYSALTFYRLK